MKNFNVNRAGYKKTPLGWIPIDWEIKSLKELVFVNEQSLNDKTPRDYSFYYFDLSSVEKGKISKPSEMMLFKNAPSRARRKFTQNDILMSTVRPNLKGIALVNFNEENVVCSTGFAVLKAKKEQDSKFIYQYLFSPYVDKQINSLIVGSNYPALNNSDLEELFLLYPTNQIERKSITSVLEAFDIAIEATEKLITAKEKLKKGLMQQLLTGKKRLKGFNGQWRKVKLFDLVKEIKRPAAWSEEKLYDLLSIRRRSGGVFYRESLYGNQILTKGLYTAKEKDFLISKMQIVHGASGLVKKEHDGMYISGSYIALAAKDTTKLDMIFFDWLSKTRKFYNLCYTSSYGVHIEKMTFDFHDFLNRSINIPTDINEQIKIAEILEKINGEIKLLKEKVLLLKQQKKGLMQVLLTGKVRVKI